MAKRVAWILGLLLLACYLGLVLFMYCTQDELLYPAPRFTHKSAATKARKQGLTPWPTGKAARRGYLAKPATRSPLGTVIVFHGNKTSALGVRYYAQAFNRLGYRVLLAEYPGYGERPGTPSEQVFVPDAVSTFDLVRREFPGPTYVVGNSLGAGVASAVVRERASAVSGVALITPWDSFANVAQEKYPYLPARFLVKSKFESAANLASYRGPKAIAIALEDEWVPNELTMRLYAGLPASKRLWKFEGAGHNTWPKSPKSAWWSQVSQYWRMSKNPN
jgi:uncharacterized protein